MASSGEDSGKENRTPGREHYGGPDTSVSLMDDAPPPGFFDGADGSTMLGGDLMKSRKRERERSSSGSRRLDWIGLPAPRWLLNSELELR